MTSGTVDHGDHVDFAAFALLGTPNQYLICPPDMKTNAEPHAHSPVFDAPKDELKEVWRDVALRQPRVTVTREEPVHDQEDYVQRSLVFRFPDTITIQYISVGEDKSTLAIYSRAKLGRGDLQVNRKRIERWLELVAAELGGLKT